MSDDKDSLAAVIECKDREISAFRQERFTLRGQLALEREKSKQLAAALEWVKSQSGDCPPADFSELVYRRAEEALAKYVSQEGTREEIISHSESSGKDSLQKRQKDEND
jgi:hypothetical protein